MQANLNLELQRPVRILIVDDGEESLFALRAILKNSSYEVDSASSGPQALEMLLDQHYVALLLDVTLLGMDGYEVASLVKKRENTRDLPIIFLSAVANDLGSSTRGYSLGAVDYLQKPLNAEIVRAKVTVFAELYRKSERIKEQADELRKAENAECEAWYLTTLRCLGEAVIATGADHLIRFMNPEAEKITGMTANEAKTLKIEAVIQATGGTPENERLAFLPRRGQHIHIRGNSSPIHNSLQEVLGSVFSFRDVSEARGERERKAILAKVTTALGNSLNLEGLLHELVSVLVPSFADFMWIEVYSGDAGDNWTLSRGLDSTWTRELSDLVPQSIDPHLKQRLSWNQWRVECERILVPSNQRSIGLFSLVRRGEEWGRVLVHRRNGLFSEAEETMLREVAHRTAIACENSRLFLEAQRAVKVRDEFLSIASHELKTPITPLILQLQSFKRQIRKSIPGVYSLEQVERMVEVSERQALRLSRLVEELLDVSRISAGKLTLDPEPLSLPEVVRRVLARFSEELVQAHIKTELCVAGEGAVEGRWDRPRLEQVVSNLLSNAMKYGGGKPIQLRIESERGVARLRMSDHGMGIAQADQSRIFSKFERATTPERVGGLGLGLYISREIIRAHGGMIRVESVPGHGASFIVELPLTQAL